MTQTGTLDPITFEVIRHRLWAINDDQARMAARLSGSFIVYEGYDFNAALVTADGRGLYCGVYILQHGATIDEFVRLILENWPAEEIRPGDMFFTNDPWWGALHANDGILAMPIFWGDELVAWSGIVMHDDDVGSPVPGSFVSGAADRFGEAPLFPGIKLVENFEPRADIERAYLRNSRTSELNALNMRARVAALRTTYQRVGELIDEYSLDVFKAAQEGIIDYVERVVRSRLLEIPDGEWYSMGYHDHDGNDNAMYPICVRVIKRADRLTVDLTGTSPQAPGSINCAKPCLDGAILGVILTFLCYDLPWAIAALRRIVEIVSEEGTLNNALSPAGVSMGSTMAPLSTQDVAAQAVAKMMLCSERYRGEAQGNWTPGVNGTLMIAPNPGGEPSVGAITDFFSGGGGARTFTDGIDSGGIFHSMASRMSNAETVESRVPVLQIYRRELEDAGGPGRFRGGVAVEFASVPHKLPIRPAGINNIGSGISVPAGRGLSGASPGAAARNFVLRGSNIAELFAAGHIPLSPEEIGAAEVDVVAAKSFEMIDEGDVLVGVLASGSGYGDALRREPERVARDVAEGLVSVEAARSVYGVVVVAGEVDEAATETLREAVRAERLADARPVEGDAGGGTIEDATVLHPVSDSVEAVEHGGERSLRCSICHYRLGPYDHDHKRSALMRERPLTDISRHNRLCLEDFVLREFYCPGCATALAADVQLREDPIIDETKLWTASPSR
ncbi:MAG TPA: hydantoinase B/oxoprolinase family protein [Solirubrobacteraceae bacterium]|jgi:N-methylhydantoinase B|nr:hydantoinase B/oxoprolinase family protein [Solirubrobacteraceae bacterium]